MSREKELEKIYKDNIGKGNDKLELELRKHVSIVNAEIRCTAEVITPLLAREILDKSRFKNRKMHRGSINRYKNIMLEGKWLVSPVPIVITKNGNLLNGQHTLMAIIEANIPIAVNLYIGNISDNIFSIIDVNRNRTLATNLEKMEVLHPTESAKVVRLIANDRKMKVTGNDNEYKFGIPIEKGIELYLDEEDKIVDSVSKAITNSIFTKVKSTIAFIHWKTTTLNSKKADEFLQILNDREHYITSALLHTIYVNLENKTISTARYVRLFYGAWNMFRVNEKPKKGIIMEASFPV